MAGLQRDRLTGTRSSAPGTARRDGPAGHGDSPSPGWRWLDDKPAIAGGTVPPPGWLGEVPDPPPARPDVLCFLSACYSPVPPCICFSLTHPVSFPPGRPRRLLIPSAHNCISQSRLRCCVRLCRVTDCSRRCSRRTPERNSLTRRGAIFTASR